MKLLTWTLKRPSTSVFDTYYKLKAGEPWYSDKYELVDPNAPKTWGNGSQTFVRMIEKYPDKFYAIGMHEFGARATGEVYNMGYGQVLYPNGYWGSNENNLVLNADKTDIAYPVPTSLRYLMHKYPKIKWSVQFLCVSNKSGNRLDPILDNKLNPDGKTYAQDVFVDHVLNIARIYKQRFPACKTVEIDFEKTTSRDGSEAGNNGVPDYTKFGNLLARIKREVCLVLDMELRVNLFAMTGDLQPAYYAWHDYRTLANVKVNGVQAIDEFQLMTYDFSWGGSAPGPSTPIKWLTQALDHVKDLHDNGDWDKADVFIGNAGYGRRWALGEDRLGSTLDYKQLMTVQNGMYIHNSGESVVSADGKYKEFHFNDQDFIPISGFNDEESDYQITYLGVYDRFKLTSNGGGVTENVNRPANAEYVTNYSRKQFPVITGVKDTAFEPVDSSGIGETTLVNPKKRSSQNPVTGLWSDTLQVAKRTTSSINFGELLDAENNVDNYTLSRGFVVKSGGYLTYNVNATGTYNLIAIVYYPFFDQAEIKVNVGGTEYTLSGNDEEWYPFMQAQEKHMVDMGKITFNGSTNITINKDTNSAQIWGFIVCESFDHNLRGGTVEFPVNTQPMLTRDPNDGNKMVPAQFPSTMRLVGEVLRRPPRPAIIWEDIFSSYVYGTDKNTGNFVPNDITSGFRYYPQATDPDKVGFSQGTWKAYGNFDDLNPYDYSHVFNDSRPPNISAQFILNKKFASDIAVDVEMKADKEDTSALYGIRVLAPTAGKTGDGYLCLLDWGREEVRIVYERNAVEDTTTIVAQPKPMSESLKALRGTRIRLRAYVKDGKISFFVKDKPYFDRVQLPDSATFNVPTVGAYGVWSKFCRLKLYKLNISSMERYERMERFMVEVEGDPNSPYYFDEVARDYATFPIDKYGLMEYTKGYPAELQTTVANNSEQDDGGSEVNTATNTVIDTQIDPKYAWSNDYKNKALAKVEGWVAGGRKVKVTMLDAGIWLKRFYVGDDAGMSVAYNSDKVGFIKTANLVQSYGCKGIALWTLGQEDPTVYTYIPDFD